MGSFSAPQGNLYKFTGTSADTKPTTAVQPGSVYTETDTLNQFIFGTDYAWHPYHEQTVIQLWQPSTLSYINATADSSGNLNTTGSGGGGGGTVTANQGTGGASAWLVTDEQYALQFDASNSPVLYLGQAAPGSATSSAAWSIQKIDTSSGVNITWANGSSSFTNIWNNRASLTYS